MTCTVAAFTDSEGDENRLRFILFGFRKAVSKRHGACIRP